MVMLLSFFLSAETKKMDQSGEPLKIHSHITATCLKVVENTFDGCSLLSLDQKKEGLSCLPLSNTTQAETGNNHGVVPSGTID